MAVGGRQWEREGKFFFFMKIDLGREIIFDGPDRARQK